MTRLRKMMLEELQRRNFSEDTMRHYIHTVEDFARHFNRPPDRLGLRHIREYQAHLFQKRKLSSGSVTNHLAALRFFYIQTLKKAWSEWNTSKDAAECTPHGQVSPELRGILVRKLRQLGVSVKAPGETYFTVWASDRTGWSLVQAYYSHRTGTDIEVCEVVAVVDQNAHVTVLRKLPLKKTDVDVPDVTQWTPLDLADTRGNGQVDVILVGDAYENHWLEVISVHNGSAETIFSGLGYYL